MATSTVISGARPSHRTARVGSDPFQAALALDWENGQAITTNTGSQNSSVFDSVNDRVVSLSYGVLVNGAAGASGCWYSIGTNPTASAGAKSQWLPRESNVLVYVPANMVVAAIQGGTVAGVITMIPALLSGS